MLKKPDRLISGRSSTKHQPDGQRLNFIYQEWCNPILENMAKEAEWELFDLDLQQIELQDSIGEAMEKLRKSRENGKTTTGNGNTGSGSGKSTST